MTRSAPVPFPRQPGYQLLPAMLLVTAMATTTHAAYLATEVSNTAMKPVDKTTAEDLRYDSVAGVITTPGKESTTTLLESIDAYGPADQSTPPRAHTLRRGFASLSVAKLRSNVMSASSDGLVLDLFEDVVIEAEKSYTEVRGDNDYSWFGHARGNPDDAVILSVVDGNMAGMVMRGGDLFHIRALASGNYEIVEIDQASFPTGNDEASAAEEIVESAKAVSLAGEKGDSRYYQAHHDSNYSKTKDSGIITAGGENKDNLVPLKGSAGQNGIKKYTVVQDRYRDFFKLAITAEEDRYSNLTRIYSVSRDVSSNGLTTLFSIIDLGVLVSSGVVFNDEYPNYAAEIQLGVDQANLAFADSDVQIQINLTATGMTYYQGTTPKQDLTRLKGTSDGYLDFIHATRDLWNWRADLITLVVDGYSGACGRAYTLFYGLPKSDWSVNGFNVMAMDCLTGGNTLAHEIGHNLGTTHDWYVKPDNNCPTGEADFGQGCQVVQLDPWRPSSYGHGVVSLGGPTSIAARSLMAYPDKCEDALNAWCPQYLRFSNPATGGVPEGEYQAADSHSVMNKNRTLVEFYR